MNTCESCKWVECVRKARGFCSHPKSPVSGIEDIGTFGCTLHEVKSKPIVFETTFRRVRCIPATATFPERDIPCIGRAFFGRRFKVTLEEVEGHHGN